MATKQLIDAIIAGDATEIEASFNNAMSVKISERLSEMKENLAKTMLKSVDQQIDEVLAKDASAGEWISDFVHSDNPKFKGKSKEKRKQMALAAYYAKQREK